MGGQALDSMDKAIDAIKYRSLQVFKFFLVQLIAFHLSSFMLMWICYDAIVALIVNIVLAIFLVVFLQNCFELYSQLSLKDEEATSNKLLQDEKVKPAKSSSARSSNSGSVIGDDGLAVAKPKKIKASDDPEEVKAHKYEEFFDNF